MSYKSGVIDVSVLESLEISNLSADLDIEGFQGVRGKPILVTNNSAYDVTLKHDDADAPLNTRIFIEGAADLVLEPGEGAVIFKAALTWRVISPSSGGGGGGTPGGSTTQVQYNNLGSFAGNAAFTFDVATGRVTANAYSTTSDALLVNLMGRFSNIFPNAYWGLQAGATGYVWQSSAGVNWLELNATTMMMVGEIYAAGAGSALSISRRDTGVKKWVLYSAAGNLQFYNNAVGSEPLTLTDTGTVTAAGAVNAGSHIRTTGVVNAFVPSSLYMDFAGGVGRIFALGNNPSTYGTVRIDVYSSDVSLGVAVATFTSNGLTVAGVVVDSGGYRIENINAGTAVSPLEEEMLTKTYTGAALQAGMYSVNEFTNNSKNYLRFKTADSASNVLTRLQVDDTGIKVSGGTCEAVAVLVNSSGVVDINCGLGDYFTLTLAANVTSITFSNLPPTGMGKTIAIRFLQDGTGGRTVALPSSFKAINGSDTLVQAAANAYTLMILTTFDQGTRWEYSMKGVAA